MTPRITVTIEMTAAKIGRSMKKREMFTRHPSGVWAPARAAACRRRAAERERLLLRARPRCPGAARWMPRIDDAIRRREPLADDAEARRAAGRSSPGGSWALFSVVDHARRTCCAWSLPIASSGMRSALYVAAAEEPEADEQTRARAGQSGFGTTARADGSCRCRDRSGCRRSPCSPGAESPPRRRVPT